MSDILRPVGWLRYNLLSSPARPRGGGGPPPKARCFRSGCGGLFTLPLREGRKSRAHQRARFSGRGDRVANTPPRNLLPPQQVRGCKFRPSLKGRVARLPREPSLLVEVRVGGDGLGRRRRRWPGRVHRDDAVIVGGVRKRRGIVVRARGYAGHGVPGRKRVQLALHQIAGDVVRRRVVVPVEPHRVRIERGGKPARLRRHAPAPPP